MSAVPARVRIISITKMKIISARPAAKNTMVPPRTEQTEHSGATVPKMTENSVRKNSEKSSMNMDLQSEIILLNIFWEILMKEPLSLNL